MKKKTILKLYGILFQTINIHVALLEFDHSTKWQVIRQLMCSASF